MVDKTNSEEDDDDEGTYLNFVQNEFGRPLKINDIAMQTKVDPILKLVFVLIKNGWPEKKKYEGDMKSYFEELVRSYFW